MSTPQCNVMTNGKQYYSPSSGLAELGGGMGASLALSCFCMCLLSVLVAGVSGGFRSPLAIVFEILTVCALISACLNYRQVKLATSKYDPKCAPNPAWTTTT